MFRTVIPFLFVPVLFVGLPLVPLAEELTADDHTVLLFHFNNSLESRDGLVPEQAEGVTFEPGLLGEGLRIHKSADMSAGDRLRYAIPPGFDPREGSVELWIQPQWIGTDFYVMQVFHLHEIVLQINTPGILVAFLARPDNEIGYLNVQNWKNTDWHHVVITWKIPGRQKMYVDGVPIMDNPATEVDLLPYPVEFLDFGSRLPNENANVIVDEFRLSDIERTPEEVGQSVMKGGFNVSGIHLNVDAIRLQAGWRFSPKILADTDIGVASLPSSVAEWNIEDSNVASVDRNGEIAGKNPGKTTFIVRYGDFSLSGTITVDTIFRPPDESKIDDFLATPAEGYLYELPVAIVNFFPLRDENYVEHLSGEIVTVEEMKARQNVYYKRMKFMLEEGSRYHGYKDPNALPSIGVRVMKIINIYEHMPISKDMCWWNPANYYPDYQQVFERIKARQLVEELGIKEFWMWYDIYKINGVGYELPESNLSSPVTGDVSNSARLQNDLPVYDRFYIVYQFLIHRLGGLHNHGHQHETMLIHVNHLQDGNEDLFIHKFCGMDDTNTWITGRCGWTHMPPNTTLDYVYDSPTPVLSDCEDWHPDGGPQKLVNVDTWRGIPYPWPQETELGNNPPYSLDFGRAENQFYMYWRQNFPGYQNGIVFDGDKEMNNWWQILADWDEAIKNRIGLYRVREAEVEDWMVME